MLKEFVTAGVLSIAATAVAADVYQCTTTNHGRGGWVGDRIDLYFDAAKGTGMAHDWSIHTIHKKPIPVEFAVRSKTSYTFKWTIKGISSRNAGSGTNSYKVTLFTNRNEYTLSGRRHGYDNVISAKGTCKRVK